MRNLLKGVSWSLGAIAALITVVGYIFSLHEEIDELQVRLAKAEYEIQHPDDSSLVGAPGDSDRSASPSTVQVELNPRPAVARQILTDPANDSIKLIEQGEVWSSPDKTATMLLVSISRPDNSAILEVVDVVSSREEEVKPGTRLQVDSGAGVFRFIVSRVGGNYIDIDEY